MNKPAFVSVLARARRKGDQWIIKNTFPGEVETLLVAAGWSRTGTADYNSGLEYGVQKDGEHIILGNYGKFPYYCGDCSIRIGKLIGDKSFSTFCVEQAR